ncbi:MAG: ArnT family glycosyltransferase, partial [Planctomycetota bacterium]
GAPFRHPHEYVLAQYAKFGDNYRKAGYVASGGAPVNSSGPEVGARPPEPRELYAHRPPMVSLFLSFAFRIFGSSEASIRGFLVFWALVTLGVFLLIARRLLGPAWGLAAAWIFAFVPLYSFYAIVTPHTLLGTLGCMLVYLFYLRWTERPDRERFWVLLAVIFVSCWTDWPAYYAVGAVGLLHVLTAKGRRWTGLLFPACAVVSFGLFVLWVFLLDPAGCVPLKDLFATAAHHSRPKPPQVYVLPLAKDLAIWLAPPLLLLAAAGAALLRPRRKFVHAAILSMVILAADLVLFPVIMVGHRFLLLPAVALIALLAAVGLQFLWRRKWTRVAGAVVLAGLLVWAVRVQVHVHEYDGYYTDMSRAMASALNRNTERSERVLIRLYLNPDIVCFHSDRSLAVYSTVIGRLHRFHDSTIVEPIDDAGMIALLEKPGHGYSWFVTTTRGLALKKFAFVREMCAAHGKIDGSFLDTYGFELESRPSDLVTFLRSRFPAVERDGFLFFSLR